MPKPIILTVRLDPGIAGEQQRENYETAAINAGYVRTDGGAYVSKWVRDVLDRAAKRINSKERK